MALAGISEKEFADLKKEIKKQYWQAAKTYVKIAPHEYFIKQWNEKLYALLSKAIAGDGREEFFKLGHTKYKNRYFYFGGHRYWVMDNVLNRTLIKCIKYDKEGVSYQTIPRKLVKIKKKLWPSD